MGERTPLAIINPAASARVALAEALTNIVAADIGDISKVKLSANWMAACGYAGEDAACGETKLILIDLGAGKNRTGGSALAQVYSALGAVSPDVDDPALLKGMFNSIQQLIEKDMVLAWHDRSDGGLFTTISEMQTLSPHCLMKNWAVYYKCGTVSLPASWQSWKLMVLGILFT